MIPTSTALTAANISIETATLVGFYVLLGIYCIFGAILYYHWDAYATDTGVMRLTLILFFSTTIPLLIIMGLMTFII